MRIRWKNFGMNCTQSQIQFEDTNLLVSYFNQKSKLFEHSESHDNECLILNQIIRVDQNFQSIFKHTA